MLSSILWFILLFVTFQVALGDIWSSYYAIPKEFANLADLKALGLAKYTENAKQIQLLPLKKHLSADSLFEENDAIVVPQDASLMFLFNTSNNSTSSPGNSVDEEESGGLNIENSKQFAQTSLPFGLPKCHSVVDFSLMIPKSPRPANNDDSTFIPLATADAWLEHLGYQIEDIPVNANLLDTSVPFVMFVFDAEQRSNRNNHNNNNTATFTNQSYHDAKNALETSLRKSSSEIAKGVIQSSEGFFDSFARIWVEELGTDTLVQSVFCQVNEHISELTYCIKIVDSGAQASVIDKDQYSQTVEKHQPDSSSATTSQMYARVSSLKGMLSDILSSYSSRYDIETLESRDTSDYEPDAVRHNTPFNVIRKKLHVSAVGKHFKNLSGKVLIGHDSSENDTENTDINDDHEFVTREVAVDGSFFHEAAQENAKEDTLLSRRSLYIQSPPIDETNCTVITWKKVFISSLYGGKTSFCSKAAAERLKGN